MGRELIEEIGEEFIDFVAQYQQIKMGTRKEVDWNKSMAAIIGAGGGAIVGMKVAGPVSRVTGGVPGFAGRAITTGATNTIASPVGSFVANGVVYGQWENPFTADSLMGGFMGGAGRTGSISPFNPEVYTTLAHPTTSLASAYDAAARADAAHAAGAAGDPPGARRTGARWVAAPARAAASRARPCACPIPRRPAPRPYPTPPRRGGQPVPRPPYPIHPRRRIQRAPRRPLRVRTTPPGAGAPPRTRTRPPPSAARPPRTVSIAPSRTRARRPAPPRSPPTGSTGAAPRRLRTARPGRRNTRRRTRARRQASKPKPRTTRQRPTTQERRTTTPTPDAGSSADTAPQGDAADHGMRDTATHPAAVTAPAADRARTALIGALATDFPDAVIGPTGDLLITSGSSVRTITAATMNRLRSALDARAEQVTDVADLQAEATAMLLVVQEGETPAQNDPAPAAPTSKPGTVTSRPVTGTRHVPDGRQGPDLTLDEVHHAFSDVQPRHFLNEDVTGFSWSQDGRVLAVHTKTNGTFYFRPVIGGLSSDLMGQTEVKTGTEGDPHLVHFGPRIAEGQVSRVWLHEITDTIHEVLSAREGKGQRVLPRRGKNTRDMCAAAQLNELAFLAEKWRQAPTLGEQRRLAVDFDGVARQLSERGHTPPLPPWAPTQATRTQQAPALPGDNPHPYQVRAVAEALAEAEKALRKQIQHKMDNAEEARKKARKATRAARKAKNQHDSGRFERARKARQEQPDVPRRAGAEPQDRRGVPGRAGGGDADAAGVRAAAAGHEPGRQTHPGGRGRHGPHRPAAGGRGPAAPSELPGRAGDGAAAGAQLVRVPADGPARPSHHSHRHREQDAEANGPGHRFTAIELEQALRADFHKAVSPDGVVLRVGRGRSAAEVRIKLTLSDLVEVLDSSIKGSEMMVGLFFQSGRTVSATESGSVGISRASTAVSWRRCCPRASWPGTCSR